MKSLEETAKLVGLNRRTIQEYERSGTSQKPEHRTRQGYLRYDEEDILRLLQIRFYRELGYEGREIREILNAPDYDQITAVTAQISLLKRKKQRLEDLITVAEAVRDGELTSEMLLQCLPGSLEAPFDVLLSVCSTGLRTGAAAGMEAEISDEDWERCFAAVEKLLELTAWGYPVEAEPVQNRVKEIHSCLQPALSPSVMVLYWISQCLRPGTEAGSQIDEAFGEGSARTLHRALEVYCEAHQEKDTVQRLTKHLENLERLRKQGLEPDSAPVQQAAEALFLYFRQEGPDPLGMLRSFSAMLKNQTVREWLGPDRQVLEFMAEAIEHLCDSQGT